VTVVTVARLGALEAARRLLEERPDLVAVLAALPGASDDDDLLCRTTLAARLSRAGLPLLGGDAPEVLYSPRVVVFKDDEANLFRAARHFRVDVVCGPPRAPGPMLPPMPPPDLSATVHAALQVARLRGVRRLVVSCIGPADRVAQCFARVLPAHARDFSQLVFAGLPQGAHEAFEALATPPGRSLPP
jgi:hypothetical protein